MKIIFDDNGGIPERDGFAIVKIAGNAKCKFYLGYYFVSKNNYDIWPINHSFRYFLRTFRLYP